MKIFKPNKTEGSSAKSGKFKNPFKKLKKWQIVAIVLVVVILLALVLRGCGGKQRKNEAEYIEDTVTVRSITQTISDSGALEPADSYTVISLVSGEILNADFDTGDVVSKDDVLYQIDSSDTDNGIERAQNSLNRSQRNYYNILESKDDLTVEAPISGKITGINARVGDVIGNNSPIATIENVSTLVLTEYYSDEYAGMIYAGMSASVSLADQMLIANGTVKEVSSLKRTSETGVSCFAVTVQVKNPGSLVVGDTATCWLNSSGGTIYPTILDEEGLEASERKPIYRGVSGEVSKIYAENNETVSKGQLILEMKSDTLDDNILDASDSLRDAELALENQHDMLENYTIKAPIDGTIVEKIYKEGENAEVGKVLCTILDLSTLSITLNVDELDIKSLAVGQRATVTADAVPGKVYDGVITEIGINGLAGEGVTTYPVTVQIDKPEGLLPGMNADVSIVITEKVDILTIPAGAVQNGNRVLVKSDDATGEDGAPEGYKYVTVELGVSDDDYVEIISGLSEGDQIAYVRETASGNMPFGMMPMGGRMPGGGGMNGNRGGMPAGGGEMPNAGGARGER